MTERRGRNRRQPRPANWPAVPAPTPPGSAWLSPPPSLPGKISFFLFSASAPRQLTGLPANGGSCLSYSRTHFLFLPAGCVGCAGTGWSPAQSPPFLPDPLLYLLPVAKVAHWRKGFILGMAPYFSQLNRPISLPTFLISENVGTPIHSQKSKQMQDLVLSCFNVLRN